MGLELGLGQGAALLGLGPALMVRHLVRHLVRLMVRHLVAAEGG